MDRLNRSMTLMACGCGLLLAATGCRSTRPEVPPGRPYSRDGRQQAPIGFSTDPHPLNGAAGANIMPDAGSKLAARAGRPDMAPILGQSSGQLGPPGTTGREEAPGVPGIGRTSPAGDAMVLPAGAPDLPRPSISPLPGRTSAPPPAGDPSATLPADVAPLPEPDAPSSQVVQPALDAPGQMGRAGDPPSPN